MGLCHSQLKRTHNASEFCPGSDSNHQQEEGRWSQWSLLCGSDPGNPLKEFLDMVEEEESMEALVVEGDPCH